MRETVRLLAETALASAIVALGLISPAGAVMPHDPPPWAGPVQIVTVEHTVEVPVSDGPQFDQTALGALAGLGVGLLWNAARRRRATAKP